MIAAVPPAPEEFCPPEDETRLRLLLAEYSEAGAYCRNHDLLTRTNNLVFIAFFVAMTGLIEQNDNDAVDTLVFGGLGILGSLLFLYVGLRTRAHYDVCLQRAHEIETVLGFDLVRRNARLLHAKRLPLLGLKLTNKAVFLSIQIAAIVYFVVKITALLR